MTSILTEPIVDEPITLIQQELERSKNEPVPCLFLTGYSFQWKTIDLLSLYC